MNFFVSLSFFYLFEFIGDFTKIKILIKKDLRILETIHLTSNQILT